MIETDFKEFNYNIHGLNSSFEGELKVAGDSIIAGNFKGQITTLGDSKITIERFASVEGTLLCYDLEIFGTFKGRINSRGTVTIRSSANASGEITAQNLNISPGAIVNLEAHTATEEVN